MENLADYRVSTEDEAGHLFYSILRIWGSGEGPANRIPALPAFMCHMGSGRRERRLRGAAGAPCAWCLQLPSPDTGTCREPPETRLDWPRQRTVPAAAPLPRVTRRTGPVTAAPATAGPCDGPGHLHVTRALTETRTAQ